MTYLVLQNRGRREAVGVDRLEPPRVVTVREGAGGGGEDFERRVRGAAGSAATRNPYSFDAASGGWEVTSRVVYLPRVVAFTDPPDLSRDTLAVRGMREPVRPDRDVEIRGAGSSSLATSPTASPTGPRTPTRRGGR